MEMPLAAAKKTKQMQHHSSEFGFGQREFALLRQHRTSFSYLQTDQEQEPRKYGQRAQNHQHCQKPDPHFVKEQDPFPAFMFAPHCVSISPPSVFRNFRVVVPTLKRRHPPHTGIHEPVF